MGQPREKPSDIWSVGVVAYLLAAQKFPFDVDQEKDQSSLQILMSLKQKITSEEPPAIQRNFSKETKLLISRMLEKEGSFRLSAKQSLNFIEQKFPEIFKKVQAKIENSRTHSPKSKTLVFPNGIFDYFSHMKLSDYLNEFEFENSDDFFELSFLLATTNSQKDIRINTNSFQQIHFKNTKIKLQAYLLKTSDKSFPTGWKLEISINGIDWHVVDRHENDEQLCQKKKIGWFPLSETVPISYLRLTFLSSSEFLSSPKTDIPDFIYLEAFEIFGEIVETEKLEQLISLPKQITVSHSIEFDFNEDNHLGLFHFFKRQFNQSTK